MSGMNKSGVPWADYTWNPIEGCSPASEGCLKCYAASFAKRFHRPWGTPVFHPEKIDQPMLTKKPGRVFVCSTSDLFHEGVDEDWQRHIFIVMRLSPQHTFMILTKRPARMAKRIPILEAPDLVPLPNVWLGVTAENQARYDERWPILASIPAKVRFVSVEPMLGPVLLNYADGKLPDWVICGPENGAGKRPCDYDWIATLSWESPCFFDKRESCCVPIRREFPRT